MAKYIKHVTVLRGSVVSDYTRPFTAKDFTYEATGERAPVDEVTVTNPTELTYPLSSFSALKTLVVQNLSSSANLTVKVRTGTGGATDLPFLLGPGGKLELCGADITVAAGVKLSSSSGSIQAIVAPGGT